MRLEIGIRDRTILRQRNHTDDPCSSKLYISIRHVSVVGLYTVTTVRPNYAWCSVGEDDDDGSVEVSSTLCYDD